ncbi:MAG: prepilin peptidase, partial [Lapillicoccus sp.]
LRHSRPQRQIGGALSLAPPLILSGGLGLVIGSFLNVVIYRVPRGESLMRPPSHCPSCGAPIRNRHNVPVLGWLVLRGRCADCGARISARYPLVEAGTAVLFVALAWRLAQLDLVSALPAYLTFAAVGIALAAIDLDCSRLPNVLVLPSYPVLAVLLAMSAGIEGDWWSLVRAGLGAAALLALYLVLVMVYPAGMGIGDLKLAGLLGLVLGYLSVAAVLVGAAAGFIFGAVVGVALMATGAANRKTAIPFGPFMIAGAIFSIFAADAVAAVYPH